MIKILIVDDSNSEVAILKCLFESQQDFCVIGTAKNGKEAVSLNESLKPDIITMDIQMPVMDGIEAIRLIMSQRPTPIIVISSTVNDEALRTTFHALEAGALSVLEKPRDLTSPNFDQQRKNIIDTLRSMAEIKVIKRRFNIHGTQTKHVIIPSIKFTNRKYEIIAIGASVGGPQALKTVISKLPADFPLPIVIVQHMTKGYITGFAQWLNDNSKLRIKTADHEELLKSGTVYFAPDDAHLQIHRRDNKLFAKLVKAPPISGFCPSITALLLSIAKTCGKNAIGILLTGMGNDGAQGLLELKQSQGHTLIQDPDSTVVFGMAGVAQSLGAVDKVIELDQLSNYLEKITSRGCV